MKLQVDDGMALDFSLRPSIPFNPRVPTHTNLLVADSGWMTGDSEIDPATGRRSVSGLPTNTAPFREDVPSERTTSVKASSFDLFL